MTRRELTERIVAAAEPVYGAREAWAIARLVAEKRYGLSRADLALDPFLSVDLGDSFEKMLADLAAARPVQYILGVADFDGLEFAVGEGVLIPRPETEELVRWIASDFSLAEGEIPLHAKEGWQPPQVADGVVEILDIGTGSGAIAIALAKRLPEARVTAIDISPDALRYARENNTRLGAGVKIIEADILPQQAAPAPLGGGLWLAPQAGFDIIVSNPPYIPASERAMMAPNVTDHEPAAALFVPDDDSLVFYRAIAKFARRNLAPRGALYFEIHENAAREVTELLEAEGFGSIEVRDDINSKPRMVKCRL
jgi:release factor glutamine methyltransferase